MNADTDPTISYTRAIKDLAEDDRPREKALRLGIGSLSSAELLAVLVGSGTRGESVIDLCQRILKTYDNQLGNIARLSVRDLTKQFRGIGAAKAITILAALELGRRYHSEQLPQKPQIISSQSAYEYVRMDLCHLPHEEFWLLTLDRSKHVTAKLRVSTGGTHATAVDSKIVLKTALDHLADGIIVVHNHPSGSLRPSINDDQITRAIYRGCEAVGIEMVDHVIVSALGYYSYLDENRLIPQ